MPGMVPFVISVIAGTADHVQVTLGADPSDRSTLGGRMKRARGVLVVAYVLLLLQTFALARALLGRVRRVAELDRRWTNLWMR